MSDGDVCDVAIPDAPEDANTVEKADVAVAKAMAAVSRTPAMKAVGAVSDLADQPPLRALCLGLIAWGLWRGDRRLAGTGARMLAAHSLATAAKTLIKRRIDRTRPTVLVEEGRYDMGAGSSHEHDESSFPSGHTAGAVAVAGAFAHDYPEYRGAAWATAAGLSLLQVPRCKHYPSDVCAGAAIGVTAAALANVAGDAVLDGLDRKM